MADEIDIVGDLNAGADDVSSNGADVVNVNAQVREPAQTKTVDTPAADDTKKPLSLRDQISSALKGEDGTPPAATKDGRARNPDGTFAALPVADATVPAEGAPAQQPVPAESAPIVAVPAGISAEVFKSLPAETQAQLARTMDDISANQQRFSRLDQVEQLISPRRDAWALNGMTDAQALNQLLALSDFAGRDPAGFIQYIAQNNGVDLEQLVLGQEPVDPKYAELQRQIAELQGARTSEQQQRQVAAHNETVNGVVAFASEKGQDGQPLRPYFDELGADVLPFISSVKAQNPNWPHTQVLQEAYDRACWGTPSVRSKMQVAANAVAEAERLRQQAERVDKARTASASVKSGAPTSAPSAPNEASRSLRDTIRASIAATS